MKKIIYLAVLGSALISAPAFAGGGGKGMRPAHNDGVSARGLRTRARRTKYLFKLLWDFIESLARTL